MTPLRDEYEALEGLARAALALQPKKSGKLDMKWWNANEAYQTASQPQTILKLIAENRAYREALEECVSVLAMQEHGKCEDPLYQREVTALGQRIGFGALMSAAQYGWRETLRSRGDPVGGEFVAGPCFATVQATLKQARAALNPAPTQGDQSHG